MIEAVNSVISNAVLARGSAEQQSVVRSFAANPEKVQEVAQAPYVSPYISMNIDYNKAVLQIRNSDTGDVIRQFPSESQLEAYRKAQAAASTRDALSTLSAGKDPVATSETSAPAPSAPARTTPVTQAVVNPAPVSAPIPSEATSVLVEA